jgi:hypothetical protein
VIRRTPPSALMMSPANMSRWEGREPGGECPEFEPPPFLPLLILQPLLLTHTPSSSTSINSPISHTLLLLHTSSINPPSSHPLSSSSLLPPPCSQIFKSFKQLEGTKKPKEPKPKKEGVKGPKFAPGFTPEGFEDYEEVRAGGGGP